MLRCGGLEIAQKVRARDIGKSREEQKTEAGRRNCFSFVFMETVICFDGSRLF